MGAEVVVDAEAEAVCAVRLGAETPCGLLSGALGVLAPSIRTWSLGVASGVALPLRSPLSIAKGA